MAGYDVAIIGGGIVGASAAAFLAEAGASVVLYERAELAAGASGRNSGSVQHPLDALPPVLHQRTLALYRELAEGEPAFKLPTRPAGLLIVSTDEAGVRLAAAEMAARAPEVQPRFVSTSELRELEPAVAHGLSACRLETGYPVEPAAATLAFARRAERAGATLFTGVEARPWLEADRLRGVQLSSGERVTCGQLLVAAGPWTADLLPAWSAGGQHVVSALWGLVITVELERPPGHMLEELGIGDLGPAGATLFSLISVNGRSGLGSLFSPHEPRAEALAGELLERGARFVPELAAARPVSMRVCARPLAFDGRPIIGAVEGNESVFVCTGHGPWGISTGPASAELVAELMLRGGSPQLMAMPELSPLRLG